ncbi:C40 family peptidase [Pseudomonas marginalis]|jgi:Cell wall-associated hydrolases (invasion-associated proteins)|uniref:NlpC/P60 family protein n=1 Tax=Pseudomonas marginalis TaxID=298 RepID=A0A9X9FZP5_PSEMA|nr:MULTISPECIES: C40 family peptidase [Pseudomonas]MDT9630320.1 NlpC/P60 family protein [Pseudomonas sp. JV449]TKJ81301.1 peptidoglycan endopeptidase [Pseudomonas sp. CFBP13509]TWR62156.1 NlpC/P60 family protein [Pseudomonas marginalis]CRM33781.1 putative endopeptidase YafL precursor [Pseudomonas sp. 8 R 14]SAM31816.1 putative endopeptidase YafL precursor [Pseudomonas sp. 1 R 17]
MFKSIVCLFIFSLYLVTPSSSANIKPRGVAPLEIATPLQSLQKRPAIDNVIDRAHQLLGTSYKWGGNTVEQGFDCSSLLVYLFRTEANIRIPRTTAAMHRSNAMTIKRNALKPGDAVFFKGNGRSQVSHVGLYIGEGKFIHSPRAGKTVRIDSLNNRYWNKNYSTAKRFHSAG